MKFIDHDFLVAIHDLNYMYSTNASTNHRNGFTISTNFFSIEEMLTSAPKQNYICTKLSFILKNVI